MTQTAPSTADDSGSTNRPVVGEYAPVFDRYIGLVPTGDIVQTLGEQLARVQAVLQPVNEKQALTLHAPYTWTLKQVLGHLTDGERVFGYRALRLARLDPTPLPGFDETQFMESADFNSRPLAELLEEFTFVRRGHLLLLRHLPAASWQFRGTIIDHSMTCRALAYVMAGHVEHHLAIVKKRLAG